MSEPNERKCRILVFEDTDKDFEGLQNTIRSELSKRGISTDLVEWKWSNDPTLHPAKDFAAPYRPLRDDDLSADKCQILIVDLRLSGKSPDSKYGVFNGFEIINRLVQSGQPWPRTYVLSSYIPSLPSECPAGFDLLDTYKVPFFKKENTEQVKGLIEYIVSIIKGHGENILWSPDILFDVHLAARSEYPVLILGGAGTGKGVIAEEIHALRAARLGTPLSQQLFALNCAQLNATFMRTDVFGYEPGSFTNAKSEGKVGYALLACGIGSYAELQGLRRRAGDVSKIEIVQKESPGTLFLDEIGDMSMDCQVMILRLLEKPYSGSLLGGNYEVTNIRPKIIAATNSKAWLQYARGESVPPGSLREDLFERLAVHVFEAPTLKPAEISAFINRNSHYPAKWRADAIGALKQMVETGKLRGGRRGLRNIVSRVDLYLEHGDALGRLIQEVDARIIAELVMPIASKISSGVSIGAPAIWELKDFIAHSDISKISSDTKEFYILQYLLGKLGDSVSPQDIVTYINESHELEDIRTKKKWGKWKDVHAGDAAISRLRHKINNPKVVQLSGLKFLERGCGLIRA